MRLSHKRDRPVMAAWIADGKSEVMILCSAAGTTEQIANTDAAASTSRAEPSRAEPSRAEPSRAEPSRAMSPLTESWQASAMVHRCRWILIIATVNVLGYVPLGRAQKYAIMISNATSAETVPDLIRRMQRFAFERYPDLNATIEGPKAGPPVREPITVRISSFDSDELLYCGQCSQTNAPRYPG